MYKYFSGVQTCVASDIHLEVEQFDHMVVLVLVMLRLHPDFHLYSRERYVRVPFAPVSFLNQMTCNTSYFFSYI